jgi:predicted oxidoreductase
MSALGRALAARGLDRAWRHGVTVDELVVEDGRVVGVVGRTTDGGSVVARGRAVVLATGGFAGSYEEVLRLAPALRRAERILVGGGAGAVGLGHRLLAGVGAAFEGLDRLWIYAHATPDPRDPSGRRGLVMRVLDSAIWVNRAGLRFHDESLVGPGSATPALLAEEGGTCWAILDRPMLEQIRIADPRFRDEAGRVAAIDELVAESADVVVADSPASLARAAGIDEAAFERTFEAWAALVRSGVEVDPLTGRRFAGVAAFGGPPYYAIRFVPLVRKNLGGVRTDLRCRVIGEDGRPLLGLYAAGELAGFGGGHLAGRRAPEGIMLGGSLLGGRVAGAWAASEAGRGAPPARWGGGSGLRA